MGEYFHASVEAREEGVTVVRVGFSETLAENTRAIPDAIAALAALKLAGGRGIRFTGRMSVPIAMALAHAVCHLYGYVACYDPKLGGYVVTISHDPGFRPGQLLPRPESPDGSVPEG
jgi:CRISPR-associated protein Csx3